MRIIFDLKSFTNKIFISIFILSVFTLLYTTIPASEFGLENTILTILDRFYYAVSTQTGFRAVDTPNPITPRAKTLTLLQMLLGYSVLLL
jgi:hypothetical protein